MYNKFAGRHSRLKYILHIVVSKNRFVMTIYVIELSRIYHRVFSRAKHDVLGGGGENDFGGQNLVSKLLVE